MSTSSSCRKTDAASFCVAGKSASDSGDYPVVAVELVPGSFRMSIPDRSNPVYTIDVAVTDDDIRKTFEMRYGEFCVNMNSLPPEDYPDHIETDEFDRDAVHFIARYRGNPVGCFRVIFPGTKPYLMERGPDGFKIESWFPRNTSCELSRMVGKRIIDPEIGEIWQSELLYAAVCYWCVEHGFTHWAFAIRERFFDRLRQLEWPFFPLSPPRMYHGIVAYPVIVNLHDFLRILLLRK
ncbi:MAG: GNAT family N-acyltransferase [Patescibacteria group bacterium]|nr:GNAT family N-acyltransferase [Patescibacteria group bacterium]